MKTILTTICLLGLWTTTNLAAKDLNQFFDSKGHPIAKGDRVCIYQEDDNSHSFGIVEAAEKGDGDESIDCASDDGYRLTIKNEAHWFGMTVLHKILDCSNRFPDVYASVSEYGEHKVGDEVSVVRDGSTEIATIGEIYSGGMAKVSVPGGTLLEVNLAQEIRLNWDAEKRKKAEDKKQASLDEDQDQDQDQDQDCGLPICGAPYWKAEEPSYSYSYGL